MKYDKGTVAKVLELIDTRLNQELDDSAVSVLNVLRIDVEDMQAPEIQERSGRNR